MSSTEHFPREIDRIEGDIAELLAYRAELEAHSRAASGWWARYRCGLKVVLTRRKIENHLRFLRLEREQAYESCQRLERDERSSVT